MDPTLLVRIASIVFRLIGLAEWFEGRMQKRKAEQKAQAVANSPSTDDEWTKAAKDGDL